MRIGLIYHEEMLRHKTRPSHPEQPERLTAIMDALSAEGLLLQMQQLPFRPATAQLVALVHEPAYVDLVQMACQEGMTFLGSQETPIGADSYDAALRAIGGVLAACDAAMGSGPLRSFCAVRPPGHHATLDQASGFCLFNNIAVAAQYLVQQHHLQRVAIVDFDVHHGDGTQRIFEQRSDVFYISLHEHPAFLFPKSGYEDERGSGPGEGHTLNIPLEPGCSGEAYQQAFTDKVLPALNAYAPQFLLISAGFDAAQGEHISDIHLEPHVYAWMTQQLVAVAEKHCGGRLVSILEGGYELDALRRSVVAHVRAMM